MKGRGRKMGVVESGERLSLCRPSIFEEGLTGHPQPSC